MSNMQRPLASAGDCGPGGWGPPPEEPVAAPTDADRADRASRRKSMIIAICTMLLSVPALIGSWCWPIFLGVIIGMLSGQSFANANKSAGSHESLISFFHGLQVAIMMTVMASVVQYGYWTVLSKRRNVVGHWAKWQPVYILMVAAVLVNVQPLMILCIGSWSPANCPSDANGVTLPEYREKWPCTNAFWTYDAQNTFFPNKASGWCIQIFCTYVGYILLIVGVFQATDMVAKLRRTWRAAATSPAEA